SQAPTTTPIAPLNPSQPPGKGPTNGTPVIVVTPVISLVAVHLAQSSAPVNMQLVSSIVSIQDNLPASLTHFGQYPDTQWPHVFLKTPEAREPSSPFIDYVEPFRPAGGEQAPIGVPEHRGNEAPAPVAPRIRSLPALDEPCINAAVDLTGGGVVRAVSENSSSRANERSERADYAWNLSTV